ncbi:MAG: 50S ribosomal protein L32 [Candidatus Zixiibacteriota bacterium]
MAVPKRRHSRTRGKKRRTHYKKPLKQVMECPNCGSPKLPHRICMECGFYNGREVLTITSKA